MSTKVEMLPLPKWRYLPGLNERHEETAFESIKGLCPETVTSEQFNENIAWLYGIKLFNNRYFWETHEVLEEVWLHTVPNSCEFYLVQGVIHIANGALKVELKRHNAAIRLAEKAHECTQLAFSGLTRCVMGISLQSINNCTGKLSSAEDPGPLLISKNAL